MKIHLTCVQKHMGELMTKAYLMTRDASCQYFEAILFRIL